MFRVRTVIVFFVWGFCLASCTPRAVREAQEVVAQADSLRAEGMIYGIDAGDSLALAQAYETLGRISRYLLPITNHQLQITNTYAHACYHYGRLLREKDDPVGAMECFINATHSRTRDYHILGRVYSNIGEICQTSGEYNLATEIYTKSADAFLSNGDTVLYFFGLNNAAFTLAERGKKDSVLTILHQINHSEAGTLLDIAVKETLMEAYLKVQQYDSALYYADYLWRKGCYIESVFIVKAQVFSFTSQNDSATYYAEQVISHSTNLFLLANAYFILTNQDESRDVSSVRDVSCKRADIQKQIEIRQGKLSQAVQLLEQDINREPDRRKQILLFILLLLWAIVCITIYIAHKHKKQAIALADKHADNVVESIKQHIDTTDINNTLHWKNYSTMKSDADLYMGGIVSKLESCNLNEVEIRFCILTLLDFRLKQIAETIHYSYPSGIKTLKKRVSDKLGTTPPELKNFLLHKM